MKLYYYSFKNKAFAPLFPRTISASELAAVNRHKNTSRGIAPLIWVAIWGVSAVAGYFASGVVLDAAGEAALTLVLALAKMIFWAAGMFLASTGYLLDSAIENTISSGIYSGLGVITTGWTVVRDFSNMFFIFALLYIAIKTILGLGGGSTKKWVANLIIAALLINFSLFATRVVVDAGNILAMGFWERMTVTVAGVTEPSASAHLMQGLKMQSTNEVRDARGQVMPVTKERNILIHLGGSLVMLIAGYVFLAGAIMMIVRTVTLIFLMIVSPFAFLGFALPVGGGFAQKWLDKLIGSTFVAPAFLAMLYLVTTIVNSPDLALLGDGSNITWGGVLNGDSASFPIIYNFLMIIILLLTSLTVANSVSNGAGDMAGRLAKRGIGVGAGAAFAGGAAGLRQTVGRAGKNRMNDKDWVARQNAAVAKGGVGGKWASLQLKTAQGANKATFDARNSKTLGHGLGMVGISAGAGTTRSYKTTGQVGGSMTGAYRGTENEKKLIETAKDRFDSPAAQKAWLERKGVELDAKRNKDIGKEINRGVKIEDVKKNVKDQPKEIRKAQQKLDDLKKDEKSDIKDIIAAEATLAKETSTLVESIKQLSGKEFEETVSQEMLTENPEIVAAMGRTALTHVNANPDIYDSATREQIANAAMTKGPEESRQYLISQQKLNSGYLPVDLAKQTKDRVKDYDVRKKELKKIQGKNDTEEVRTAIQKLEEEHGSAIQDIIGGMKVKDVAKLDDALKSHESLVKNYTPKHYEAIAGYHKNIKIDRTDEEKARTQNTLSTIRAAAMKTVSGKKYMNTEGGKPFGGGSGQARKDQKDYETAQQAAVVAEDKYKWEAQKTGASYNATEVAAAKQAHEQAQAAEAKAKERLSKATDSTDDDADADIDPTDPNATV